MLFTRSRSNSAQTKAASSCDVFATACDLKSQLHTIEEQFLRDQELGDDLKRKCSELQEVLRLFGMIEENEKKATRELEEELEDILRNLPHEYANALGPAMSSVGSSVERPGYLNRTSRGDPAADKENAVGQETANVSLRRSAPKAFPRNVIPDSWRERAETDSLIANTTCAPESDDDDSTCALSTAATCGGTLVRKKLKSKRNKALDKLKHTDWRAKPYKARKQFKAPCIRVVPRKDAAQGSREAGSHICEEPQRQGLAAGAPGMLWNAASNAENMLTYTDAL